MQVNQPLTLIPTAFSPTFLSKILFTLTFLNSLGQTGFLFLLLKDQVEQLFPPPVI